MICNEHLGDRCRTCWSSGDTRLLLQWVRNTSVVVEAISVRAYGGILSRKIGGVFVNG